MAGGLPVLLFLRNREGVSNCFFDRMFNFFTEIIFFKFPELSYTLTSCIKLTPLTCLYSAIIGKKKATPKRSGGIYVLYDVLKPCLEWMTLREMQTDYHVWLILQGD